MIIEIESVGNQFIVSGPNVEKKIFLGISSALDYINKSFDDGVEEREEENEIQRVERMQG